MSLSKAIPLLVISLCLFNGCAYVSDYVEPPQQKATTDLIKEKTRSLELDNQIKAEQLKQAQLQTAKLEEAKEK